MLRSRASPREALILDACCVITLAASGRMAGIVASLGMPVAVADFVREREVRLLASGDPEDPGGGAIDLGSLVDAGLLEIVGLERGDEHLTFLDFARHVDDGEALTGAIALHRDWAMATDDARACAFLAREAPQLPLLSTPELVRHWVEQERPSAGAVREVLARIRRRARYAPGRNHPLARWWEERC